MATVVSDGQEVQSESYYYRHVLYIKGLQSNAEYHCQIKVQGYDGQTAMSELYPFKTKPLTDVVCISELPYTIEKSGKYVLTQDITTAGLGINIKAHDVELDLDGHIIVYDNKKSSIEANTWDGYAYHEQASFGIRSGLWNFKNIKVFNGTITQGKNGGRGVLGVGYNPLFLFSGTTDIEVAGVTVDYYGDSVSGMIVGDGHIHHNIVYDRGTGIDDRHQGIKSIAVGNSVKNEVAYNSLRRFRHQGIMGNGYRHHNEVYADSFDTNSFLIGAGPNGRIEHNKMFGMGYMPMGTNWGTNAIIKNNFIYLHGTAPTQRSAEYPRLSGITGMRLTIYGDSTEVYENSLYEGNTVVLKAWEGCTVARGIWTSIDKRNKSSVYRNNTIKVEVLGKKQEGSFACIYIFKSGDEVITFENNILIGDIPHTTIERY